MRNMRYIMAVVAVTLFTNLHGAVASSFNDATSARFTLEGTAKNYITGEVRTGVLGQGTFSYTAGNWEKTYQMTFMDPAVTIAGSDNYRLVTNFQADLFGKQFGPTYFGGGGAQFAGSVDYLWKLPLNAGDSFPGGGIETGMVLQTSAGGPQGSYVKANDWRFGTSSVIVDTLILEPNGKWSYINSGGPGEPLSASGTWSATPESVPEPMTIAATGVAVALGLVFRKLKMKSR